VTLDATEYQARLELAKKKLLDKEEQTRKQQHQEAEVFKASGNSKLQANQFEDAIKCYDDAIRLNPDNAIYYANRFVIHAAAAALAMFCV
jgi:tetratricopeptide (TPR) repeat protein